VLPTITSRYICGGVSGRLLKYLFATLCVLEEGGQQAKSKNK